MRIVDKFPRRVREIENTFIEMSDGCRLAARIWLPEDAEQDPVPAILEYLPYRKRDGTVERDQLTQPYFAGHGYAGVRVDMRGSGESDGILEDEYLKLEQDDCLEVLRWIAAQPWCSGAVGMIGISWGGFNGLQVAARRPPELKAVVTLCSTDDRYADDVHYMGGCLLNDNLAWASTMFAIQSQPPDPALVGERWREMWMQRLEEEPLLVENWLRHQRRDEFWKHGSVCENFADIQCPVYAVGGWADGYSNAIPRLLEGLNVPRKGLIGPWVHKYPHFAKPGPAIGFLQECLRWWDQWLKGEDTGIMDEPMYRVWMQTETAPQPSYKTRPGRWVAEPSWPSAAIEPRRFALNADGLAADAAAEAPLLLRSPQTIGHGAGAWCAYGTGSDQPTDQRADDGKSLLFDSAPLDERLEILGAPVVTLDLAADRPNAFVAVRLNDVAPDGASTRISYGLLNLTHRDSHEQPTQLEPGKRIRVTIKLNDIAHSFAPGHRIRVALSSSYWPIAWPSPEPVTLTLFAGASSLDLPTRSPREDDATLPSFPEPEGASPVAQTVLSPGRTERVVERDIATGEMLYRNVDHSGRYRLDAIGLELENSQVESYRIGEHDPNSAVVDIAWSILLCRGDWQIRTETRTVMRSTATDFLIDATLDAYEGETRVLSRNWNRRVPRDLV
ncbi:CocE/NonD family hydrolase [Rhodospirillaceae bacterium SYSU D60014]|uniref:CocE/NonD family hydrolase n=1 Tax=Virgifigura deserti TaxID=2268457 RepID=UPI000E6736DD